MNNIAEKLIRLRKNSGYTQKIFAEIIGVSQPSLVKFEKGETNIIQIGVAKKIANELDIPFNELFEIESNNAATKLLELNYINLQKEYEALKDNYDTIKVLAEHNKGRIESANESWEELKILRNLTNTLEYLDYIDQSSFKKAKANEKYFRQSLDKPYILIKEFNRFFFSLGKNAASLELRKYINIYKFKDSDLIIQESKFSGRSVANIVAGLKKLQSKK